MSDSKLEQGDSDLLVQAVFAVFRLVAQADGSIDGSELKRFEQMLRLGAEAGHPQFRGVLQQAIAERESRVSGEGSTESELLATLRKASEVLDTRMSEQDARGFKTALVMLGNRVGEASRDGLFGLKDSGAEAESRALSAIQQALGISFL